MPHTLARRTLDHSSANSAIGDDGVIGSTQSCRWSDTDTFVLYSYFDRHLRSWTITAADEPDRVRVACRLWESFAEIREVDGVVVLTPD
ncbi:hypothetical protein [Mycobacterium sp.]|uniref:hypothetical protein n=1 Tax=Mycobacterium sp. TaxID=1785 RepID=UPI003C744B70